MFYIQMLFTTIKFHCLECYKVEDILLAAFTDFSFLFEEVEIGSYKFDGSRYLVETISIPDHVSQSLDVPNIFSTAR